MITLLFGVQEEGVRILIRWSVRVGGIAFATAFVASSLHYFLKTHWSSWLLKHRSYIGLTFVTFHTFHLIYLVWLQWLIHPVFELAQTTSLIGGSIAYFLMYLMAFTTFPGIKKKLRANQWVILHTLGGYWIWIIFFRSYLRNVVNHDRYLFLLILFTFIIILRILKLVMRKQNKEAF